ncbi:MAG: biotin/lipoyl-binding protein, partial [Campylobacterota bacterium]|nr:biotin/lipoyl-binding protein [Campylobacterota bacterium]
MTYLKNFIYKKYLIYLAIIGIIGFSFYYKVYIPKHTFKTINASIGDMTVKVNGVGNIGAKEIYEIGSIYGGKVLSFNINEGDFIQKGDLVAKIDSIDLSHKILEQEANIEKLQSDIKALNIDKQGALALYHYHEGIFKKNEVLFKKGVIPEHNFIKLKTDRDVAKFSVSSLSLKI